MLTLTLCVNSFNDLAKKCSICLNSYTIKTLQIKKNSSHTKLQINVIHIFADSQIGRRNQLEDAYRYVLCVQRCLQSTDLQIYRTG